MTKRAAKADKTALLRVAHATSALEARGLLEGRRSRKISARVDAGLIEAARQRIGGGSDSDTIAAALAVLAGDDGFGAWLVSRRGALPESFELDF